MSDPGKKKRKSRADGEGSIRFEAKRKRWRGEIMFGYTVDGKADRRYVYAATQSEVKRKLDDLKVKAATGQLGNAKAGQESLAAFLTRWVESLDGTRRDTTIDRYRVLVEKHLIPALGHIRLADLRPEDLVKFYANKRKQKVKHGEKLKFPSARLIRYLHTTIRLALSTAVKWRAVARNVAADVDAPRVPRTIMTCPAPADLVQILASARANDDPLTPLLTLAVYSGARQGELLGLDWKDVNIDAGTIRIERTLISSRAGVPTFHEPKTAASRRTVSVPRDAVLALLAQRQWQQQWRRKLGDGWIESGLVFTTEVGTPLNASNVVHRFKRALRRAGVSEGFRFHDLRHSAATLMLAAHVHPKVASERLGHSTVAITLDLYSHVLQGLDAEAGNQIQDILRAAGSTVSDSVA